ncbi:MAG: ImmA/IrrE family metallo-endopeptidase [Ruminococcus sp.]|nr:ImmA/IrrE family metallo-endopeptidase [Ruminococcus sp.]
MAHDIYKQARDTAWKFLIDNHVTSLPVKLSAICQQRGISLLYDHDRKCLSGNERGCTFTDAEKGFSIILKPDDSIAVQRYTIAHELGHIFLDHFKNKTLSSFDMEYQAERFAIDILAPACVLWGLNLHNAKDISEVCNISISASQRRAERMKILYNRNKFLISPIERQVFKQFSNFIAQHKLK